MDGGSGVPARGPDASLTPGARIVIASGNAGKIAEVAEILAPLGLDLMTREDFESWPEVEETAGTYAGNAHLKASAIRNLTGLGALADDSGIEVDALGGRPGVMSARFAGPGADDAANNALLASQLAGVPPARRGARYRCVCVLLTPDGREITAEGTCEGAIATEPRGTGGFGYDPWFVPAGESRTMAELNSEEKHAISHRGKALRALAAELRRQGLA